jgi:hypothetical protein
MMGTQGVYEGYARGTPRVLLRLLLLPEQRPKRPLTVHWGTPADHAVPLEYPFLIFAYPFLILEYPFRVRRRRSLRSLDS